MTLAANDPRPKSVQAADTLRDRINNRRYPDGKLPPSRELAKEFGIAGETVARALRILVAEGLIFSAGNRGFFITGDSERAPTDKPDVLEEIKEIRSQMQKLSERVAALEERSTAGGA